ncbi:MAG TPA: hypothetical protein VMZ91_10705 [Candidatus Paceibacterota bacterium]|nr:hypothetical protein [Candidatus Paceibacterota bacterium]
MAKRQDPIPPSIDEIDISKINNLEAAQKTDRTFKKIVEEKIPLRKKRKGTGKFNFKESELVPLPSKGLLYENVTDAEEIFKGYIKLFPMTLKEEEILSTPRFLKSGSATRMILENCIDSEIDAKDILLFDSNFLMFYLRQISYGDEYTFTLKCSNNICEQKFEHTVNISELKFEELPESTKEPLIIQLPKCGFTVETILPRLYHSEEIYMRNRSRKKNTDDEDRRILDNLVTTTISIKDIDGKEIPKRDWEDFYEAITGIDAAELREKTKFDTGVDKLEGLGCPYCGEDYSGTIPIGIEFFRF